MTKRYVGFGGILHSDVPIYGAPNWEDLFVSAERDIVVRLLREIPRDAISRLEAHANNGEVIFSVPKLAHIRCREGRVDIAPCTGADMTRLQETLVATALPAVLWLEHALVLHAGAVVLPDRAHAIAIAGPSGIGKSSVLRGLVARGAQLVADDSIRLVREAGEWLASGLPGGCFLPVSGGGRIFHSLGSGSVTEAPLAAILFLSHSPAAWAMSRLAGVGVVEAVLANHHRPQVPALLGRAAETLRQSAELATAASCWGWRRTADWVEVSDAEFERLLAL